MGIYVANNYNLPFHLRTDIYLNTVGNGPPGTFAYSSVRFGLPDTIVLRKGGLSPHACASTCSAQCTARFKVQAYHSDDDFLSSINYAIGNAKQMGQYKCLEHLSATGTVLTDPNIAPQTPLTTYAARCPSGMTVPVQPPGMTVTLSGEVTFPVDTAGIWQATIMATCIQCYGGSDGKAPVDLLIIVQDSASDPNPPVDFFNGTTITGLTPVTTRSNPININCGRPGFFFPSHPTASKTIRVAFYDPDDGLTVKCVSSPNTIASISRANTFPEGVVLGALTQQGSYGYLDVNWQPRCEDVAQAPPAPPSPSRPPRPASPARGSRARAALPVRVRGSPAAAR